MTDETTTRTRRRVRAKPQSDQATTGEGERQRAGGRGMVRASVSEPAGNRRSLHGTAALSGTG
jgi:hypothetical protein